MTHISPVARVCVLATAVAALLLASCASPASTTQERPESASPPTNTPAQPATTSAQDAFLATIPAEARRSNGGGDPRPAAYWSLWNSCAPENRAAEAAANGGRAAGWILVDDLLADPGLQLGDHRLSTCDEALALLLGQTATGQETGDPTYGLAAQLLAAELNLSTGAETCPIAEEVVFGAHLVLANTRFDGARTSLLNAEATGAVPQLTSLLTSYNLGTLCQ